MRSPSVVLSKPDQKFARRLLELAEQQPSIGQRMKLIAEQLLGLPYIVNPLIGSATEPEEFVVSLAGFDCVTFMETVLALALADEVSEFPALLREIRYIHGDVSWDKRHHYTVNWAWHNTWRGFVRDVTKGELAQNRTKTLDLIKELPQRIVSFNYFPKGKLSRLIPLIEDGDLIFFVSMRNGLDVFHTGLLFWEGESLMMYHAARSRGEVVRQELKEFVKSNRTSGFIVVRPCERAGRKPVRQRRLDESAKLNTEQSLNDTSSSAEDVVLQDE